MGGGLLIAFVLLTILSGAAIIWGGQQLAMFAFIVPIVFLFIAIGAFLLLLLHYAWTLHEMKRDLRLGALGLPDGSIRAFLTIGLLALVAVFGTFIFFESGRTALPAVRSTVPIASLDELATIKSSAGDRVSVIPREVDGQLVADIIEPPDGARNDIAKQLLTMIATVLTTVIGFYFGTRTTEGPTGAPGASPDEPRRRNEVLDETSRLTQDLAERERRVNDLVTRAESVASGLKGTTDPQGTGEQKVSDLKAKLRDAVQALGQAKTVATERRGDAKEALEAFDAAKRADATVTEIEIKLTTFVEKRDPSAL